MTRLWHYILASVVVVTGFFLAEPASVVQANTAPVASDKDVTTEADTTVIVILSATDVEDCELTFSIVDSPSSGDLGPLTDQPCTLRDPNADSAFVLYTPNTGFFGTDTFT